MSAAEIRVEMKEKETKEVLTKWSLFGEVTRVGEVKKASQRECKRELPGDKWNSPMEAGKPYSANTWYIWDILVQERMIVQKPPVH